MADPFHAALKTGLKEYRDNLTSEGEDAATSLAGTWDKGRDWLYSVLRGEIRFPASLLPEWILVTGDYTPLEWICKRVNVIPVRVDTLPKGAETAAMLREVGKYLQDLADANADGVITADEAKRLRADAENVVAALFAEVEAYERRATNGGRVRSLREAG